MKQRQQTIRITPDNGSLDKTELFTLNGYVESMVAYTRGTESKLQGTETALPLIFMALQDDANGDIIPMILLDNYKQTAGEYSKSFKPLGFATRGQKFSLVLNTERVSTGAKDKDIEVFVTFFYGQEPQTVAPQPAPSNARPKSFKEVIAEMQKNPNPEQQLMAKKMLELIRKR